jgi:hypothetical protein
MNDLAVVRARCHPGPRFFFEDAHAAAAARDRQRGRQSHHPTAYNDSVDLLHDNRVLI